MTKLTCMRGYSGSGKSTRAREIADEAGAVIVCRDDLRKMLLGSYWTGKKDDEDRVTVAEEAQVTALLNAGADVISDATHLHPPYLRKWAKLATKMGIEFEVVDIRTELADCIFNDAIRERSVGADVIRKQEHKWPVRKWPIVTAKPFTVQPVEYVHGLPDAIVVDIDGTLAHMTGRSPYDYTRVGEDVHDIDIAGIVRDWHDSDGHGPESKVIIVSGRDSACRDVTIKWLDRKWIYYDQLIMRPDDARDERGNKAPDYQVKYHLFNEHIRGQYNVRFVLDDRTQVVEMWRKLGLKCLQVQDGDF